MKTFRFKSRYFVFLFFIFLIIINIAGIYHLRDTKDNRETGYVVDVDYNSLKDALPQNGIAYVLFYYDDSAFSEKMESNLQKLAQQEMENVHFFKLNLNKYLGQLDKHDYSFAEDPLPYVHIYSNSEKVKQIAGVVSESNLQMIHQKVLRSHNISK